MFLFIYLDILDILKDVIYLVKENVIYLVKEKLIDK